MSALAHLRHCRHFATDTVGAHAYHPRSTPFRGGAYKTTFTPGKAVRASKLSGNALMVHCPFFASVTLGRIDLISEPISSAVFQGFIVPAFHSGEFHGMASGVYFQQKVAREGNLRRETGTGWIVAHTSGYDRLAIVTAHHNISSFGVHSNTIGLAFPDQDIDLVVCDGKTARSSRLLPRCCGDFRPHGLFHVVAARIQSVVVLDWSNSDRLGKHS